MGDLWVIVGILGALGVLVAVIFAVISFVIDQDIKEREREHALAMKEREEYLARMPGARVKPFIYDRDSQLKKSSGQSF